MCCGRMESFCSRTLEMNQTVWGPPRPVRDSVTVCPETSSLPTNSKSHSGSHQPSYFLQGDTRSTSSHRSSQTHLPQVLHYQTLRLFPSGPSSLKVGNKSPAPPLITNSVRRTHTPQSLHNGALLGIKIINKVYLIKPPQSQMK